MLDLHRLRLLRELKHRGTLAAVAKALSYSPSAISQHLSRLESEAGVRLLEPVGRGVRLTPQADILVAHAEAVLERLEQAQASIALSLADITGTLRVAAFQTAALSLIPPTLSRLAELHPMLRVEVTEMEPEESLPRLVARRFDLVLGEEYPGHPQFRPPELEQEDLIGDPMRLARPVGGPNAAPGELRELAATPWVLEPEGTAARHWAVALCRDAGFEPEVRFQSTDLLLHVRLVETGHAAAFLPDLVWLDRAPPDHLLPLPGAPVRRIFTAVRRGAGQQPAVRALRDILPLSVELRGR